MPRITLAYVLRNLRPHGSRFLCQTKLHDADGLTPIKEYNNAWREKMPRGLNDTPRERDVVDARLAGGINAELGFE